MYQRRELWLLSLFTLALAVGFLVQHFRAGFPDLTRQLESVDGEESAPADAPSGRQDGFASPPQKLAPAEIAQNGPIDLNRAAIADLQRLPGIGPTLAKRIVEARDQRGRLEGTDDLLTVPGIGAKKFEAIKALVTVGAPDDG